MRGDNFLHCRRFLGIDVFDILTRIVASLRRILLLQATHFCEAEDRKERVSGTLHTCDVKDSNE